MINKTKIDHISKTLVEECSKLTTNDVEFALMAVICDSIIGIYKRIPIKHFAEMLRIIANGIDLFESVVVNKPKDTEK